jgi:hypothetical protein
MLPMVEQVAVVKQQSTAVQVRLILVAVEQVEMLPLVELVVLV